MAKQMDDDSLYSIRVSTKKNQMAKQMEIDDSLYSRQRYVLGDSAMHQMAHSSVFLSGVGGLGVEIAKNVILAGVKAVTIHDPHQAAMVDLSSQFFLREEDVSMATNRAEASLSKLRELNPYVTVSVSTNPLAVNSDLSFFSQFQCVILTDAPLDLQLAVDNYCRSQVPSIKFISCSVRGVFSSVFCDFGTEFTVCDDNGEEPVECFIGNITMASPGVVRCLENEKHGLQSGDQVIFREVKGMTAINGTTHTVRVLSPSVFSIGDTSGEEFKAYQHGGIVRQVKVQRTLAFESLNSQLRHPDILLADFAKMEAPLQTHLSFLALDRFIQETKRLPNPRDDGDATLLSKLATDINNDYKLVDKVDSGLLSQFSFTARAALPPLCTAVGGLVAQEALIALTGKFSPLQQWLYLDASEVLSGQEKCDPQSFQLKGDRYDAVRVCLGEDLLQKLADLKLFMVGCGAIGCEMLKNYAMLGVGRKPHGLITITDNDLIEKSNLNRQFLFRPQHIQQPKSVVAAQSITEINPDLSINAQQYKVFPGTEAKIYHDGFFMAQEMVVNALDNVEARRYVDSRCVTNQRPLLESGTMGAKGHVQVVVPNQTESYSSQQDPPDKDVPYCTLKSFPATIEHCIQWARDKFESLFTQKPTLFSKFWDTHKSPEEVLQLVRDHHSPDGVVKVVKMFQSAPTDWPSCVRLARVKFEKYFNHKARNLLHAFPVDTKMKDGSLFWQSPKRPPNPLTFDASNPTHMSFVVSFARLCASLNGVQYSDQDLSPAVVDAIIQTFKPIEYRPSSKVIVTDESAKKPEQVEVTSEAIDVCQASLEQIVSSGPLPAERYRKFPQSFEKDDDSNGHIDFITAASNLRAMMYSIDTVDRFKTKLIAGRIVPAIATTTAAVAGLVSIELIKVVMGLPRESLKNCFLNLALPSLLFSEPAPPIKTIVNSNLSFTLWDKWEVKGTKTFKLQDFLKAVKESYGCEPAMVVLGVKMVYVPWMPGHRKRLTQTMVQLLKPGPDKMYVDLTVAFESEQGEDTPGPPVRYYFQ